LEDTEECERAGSTSKAVPLAVAGVVVAVVVEEPPKTLKTLVDDEDWRRPSAEKEEEEEEEEEDAAEVDAFCRATVIPAAAAAAAAGVDVDVLEPTVVNAGIEPASLLGSTCEEMKSEGPWVGKFPCCRCSCICCCIFISNSISPSSTTEGKRGDVKGRLWC
jgi:hypothetical protein